MAKRASNVLIRLIQNSNQEIQNIAEIGMWKCHTVRRVLKACHNNISQYWGIDHWQKSGWWRYRKLSSEQWERYYFEACKLMCRFPKLHIVRMTSLDAAKLFPEGYFDLVFVDADHSYEAVIDDKKAWLPLIRKGGLLTGHDYYEKKPGVIKAVDECFGNNVEITSENVWIKKV